MKNNNTKVTDLSAEQQIAIIDTKNVLASKQDVLMQIGQIKAFDFVSKLLTVSNIKTLQEIKESKSYKGLTYIGEDQELLTVSSFDDLCVNILQTSRANVDNHLLNFKVLGEEFFEASQRIGLGVRELRKLRQLPSADQALVIDCEAIDLGDKDAVKDLIEDLTEQHTKEKSGLSKELNEAQQLAKARKKIAETNASLLAEKTEECELALAGKRITPTSWLKTVQNMNLASSKLATQIAEHINGLHELAERIMIEEDNHEHSEQALEMMANVHVDCVDQIFLAMNTLSMETHERFGGYINTARRLYSQDEIDAIEKKIEERG